MVATGRDFETEWIAVQAQVRAFCRRHLDNPADADDVVQHVAVRAWRGYATFRGDAAFLSWVLTIARNEINRYGARLTRRGNREQPFPGSGGDTDEPPWEPPAPEPEPPPPDLAWLVEAAQAAVASGELSEIERAVIVARLAEPEPSWEAIGARHGLTANAAAVTHCRAIPRLRVFLVTHQPDRLGGRETIAEAFAEAQHADDDPLSADEAEVFRRIVLDGDLRYRKVGWRLALRSAAAKVVKHVPLPGQ